MLWKNEQETSKKGEGFGFTSFWVWVIWFFYFFSFVYFIQIRKKPPVCNRLKSSK